MNPRLVHFVGLAIGGLNLAHLVAANYLGESAPLTAFVASIGVAVQTFAHSFAGHSAPPPASK